MYAYLLAAWVFLIPVPPASHISCPHRPNGVVVCTPGMSRIHGQRIVTGPVVASWR